MNWNQLLSSQRFGHENQKNESVEIARTQFQRDYDRILFSSPFRRLQNKTQVFPLPRNIFVHNRLTHSLEVASVGRSLGNLVAMHINKLNEPNPNQFINEIGTIVSAGCLAHDLGNPPFGHAGEDAISNFFKQNQSSLQNYFNHVVEWNDLINFEGNANALRLLTHQFKGRRKGGFSLTYSTLASIIKYPYTSIATEKKKYGFFHSESHTFKQIKDHLNISVIDKSKKIFARHPLVYLVEAADDICYQVMDLEDAHKLGIIDYSDTKQLFYNFIEDEKFPEQLQSAEQTLKEVTDINEQITYLRAVVINKLVNSTTQIFIDNYSDIMKGLFEGSLIKNLSGNESHAMQELIKISIDKIYRHKSVVEIEIAGYKIIGSLLEEFVNALITKKSNYTKSILSLIPKQFDISNKNPYDNFRSVLDFISGMTDGYALNLYRKIKGINLPEFR